jgi:hypothetical protein
MADLLGACSKQKDELPPITHEGKNILAFKISDDVYYTYGEKSRGMGSGDFHWVSVALGDSTYGSLSAKGFHGNESFALFAQLKKPFANTRFILDGIDNSASLSSDDKGLLEKADGYVQFNYISPTVVAGIFDITFSNGTNKVHLTEGRFDAKQ